MTTTPRLPNTTAIIYTSIHQRLTAIGLRAHAGNVSRFEDVNRVTYQDARAHLRSIEDADGDALSAALLSG